MKSSTECSGEGAVTSGGRTWTVGRSPRVLE